MRLRPALLAALVLAACADAPDPVGAAPEAAPVAAGEVAVPADSGALAPRLALDGAGRPLLSWVEPADSGHALRYARWDVDHWTDARTAAEGTDWFVNWADTPGVMETADGRLVAHTLPRHPGDDSPYAYDAAVRQMTAAGWGGWTEPRLLHDDGRAAEHGFVSAVALPDGRTGLVWLDGRNQGGHGHGGGAMTLRYAALDVSGALADEAELDTRTCDCCPTAAAATPSGLVVAYRDRSAAEVRDIAVVRLVDGAWTDPTIPHPDGWTIAGCPVNGPALASRGDRVALAWYSEGDGARVQLAASEDGGATWGERVRIDGESPIGRVGVALMPDGSAVVSWLATVGDAAELRLRRVAADGTRGESVPVATVAAGRSSGMPHVVALGGQALVAWTDPATATVRTAVVDV
ncbi:hypothetical protein [Rubrivirga marina]|uniref:hypothetical protein n=1 Tax=Rubrivirga marina TaxID=1196024 RepID=UPI001179DE2D|nr:hypothetical protein [Rubrivirga marina]